MSRASVAEKLRPRKSDTPFVAMLFVSLSAVLVIVLCASIGIGENPLSGFIDTWVYNAIDCLFICAMWTLPKSHPYRFVWRLIAFGELFPMLGELYIQLRFGGYENLPAVSFADLLFALFFPFTAYALFKLSRADNQKVLYRSIALDTCMTVMTATGFLVWLVLDEVAKSIDGSPLTQFVKLLSPVLDVLTVAIVAMSAVTFSGFTKQRWRMFFVGALLVRALAGCAYYLLTVRGTYVEGGWLDVAWPIAAVGTGYAAISAKHLGHQGPDRTWFQLALPSFLGVASIAMLVVDRAVGRIPLASLVLALGVLVLFGIRNIWTFRELQQFSLAKRDLRTDELTGIGNRRLINEELAQRESTQRPFAVAIIDLDRFKEVNDSLGHAAGDELIRQFAARLERSMDRRGVTARLAGDEFAVVIDQFDDLDGFMDRLHDTLTQPYELQNEIVRIGASIGVARFPNDANTVTKTLACADHAMYRAKVNRRGWLQYDAAHDQPERDRLELNEGLRTGILGGLVIPYYQAKIDLGTRRTIGFEALARWEHPEHGIISPERFLPIAERAGLMMPLTRAMIRAVAIDIRDAANQGSEDFTVAINIDAQSLASDELTSEIKKILDDIDVDPHRIIFEVTESSLMVDRGRSIACLHRLRQLGCAVSVDDYGTGYSSLAYLRDLPINELKLDRTFAARIDDPVTRAIVRSTVALASELGLGLVVEGIEHETMAEQMTELGCTIAQGYHFHRPQPFADLMSHSAANALITKPSTTRTSAENRKYK
jgi:diguanylate cyclase